MKLGNFHFFVQIISNFHYSQMIKIGEMTSFPSTCLPHPHPSFTPDNMNPFIFSEIIAYSDVRYTKLDPNSPKGVYNLNGRDMDK